MPARFAQSAMQKNSVHRLFARKHLLRRRLIPRAIPGLSERRLRNLFFGSCPFLCGIGYAFVTLSFAPIA